MALEEVEFDVHPTLDGKIIVNHDPSLDRTTNCSGVIAQMNAADVQKARIKYGQGGHPLLLEELCGLYKDSPVAFRCEVKAGADGRLYPNFVPKVVAALAEADRLSTTVFTSFIIETLDEFAVHSDRPRLWLVSPIVLRQIGVSAVIDLAKSHGIPEIGVHIDTADAALMHDVQEAGLDFGCWGAHTEAQIAQALDLGVKVFTTDCPSLAISMRAQRLAELKSAGGASVAKIHKLSVRRSSK